MLQILVLYALFAGVYIVAKVTLDFASPIFIVGSRMFVAGVLLLGYQLLVHRSALKIGRQHWWTLFQLGIFNIYFTNVLAFIALQDLTPFKSCFIYSFSPFITALFSYFLFFEAISARKWVGLTVGFIGIIPLLLEQSSSMHGEPTKFSEYMAIGLMFLSVISDVYGWILLKKLVWEEGMPSSIANGWSMLVGGFVGLVHSFFVEPWNPIPVTSLISYSECFLFLIIISNFVCYNLYGVLLKKYSATLLSLAGFMTPLFTAFFGWIFLDIPISLPIMISASIVFSGLWIFSQEELAKERAIVMR